MMSQGLMCDVKQGMTSLWSRYSTSGPGTYFEAKYDYGKVLEKSILFYEAQRSGKLPANNRIPWRGDSAMNDGRDVGLDLTGGWYEGGGYDKPSLVAAFSVTCLAWGVLEFSTAYESTHQLGYVLDSIKWPLDYFIKCHVGNKFYEINHFDADYHGRPEEMTMERPAFGFSPTSPGTEVFGEVAAAMAASSLVFRNHDSAYASELLTHARELFTLGYNHRGIYSETLPSSRYKSTGSSTPYEDELAWAAIWLYQATGEEHYKNKALAFYQGTYSWSFDWNYKMAGIQLIMYKITKQSSYANTLTRWYLEDYMLGETYPSGAPWHVIEYTPGGLVWRYKVGTLRLAANAAFLALVADKYGIMSGRARNWAKRQIDYMLGTNPPGRSYVAGFGIHPPERLNHRASSCPDLPAPCAHNESLETGPNPQILYGALVGGPDIDDNYGNDRSVAVEYNACFQSSIAGIIAMEEKYP